MVQPQSGIALDADARPDCLAEHDAGDYAGGAFGGARTRTGHLRPAVGYPRHAGTDYVRQGRAFGGGGADAVYLYFSDYPAVVRRTVRRQFVHAVSLPGRVQHRRGGRGAVDFRAVAQYAAGHALHLCADYADDAALRPRHAGGKHARNLTDGHLCQPAALRHRHGAPHLSGRRRPGRHQPQLPAALLYRRAVHAAGGLAVP